MSDALSNVVDSQLGKNPKRMFTEALVFLVVLIVCSLAYKISFTEKEEPKEPPPEKIAKETSKERTLEHAPVDADVQMALILDTSASMDGLIRQARDQILEITKDLQKDEQGKPRTLAVALYRYGSDRAPAKDGYIECLVPLTTDHSKLVEALGWLEAGGSEEYAPLAIATAVKELAWNLDTKVPKVVVIVGNESFAAGPKGTEAAFKIANSKKIRVLPIYCVGKQASPSAVSSWRRAAYLAKTELEMIDPNLVVAALDKPLERDPTKKVVIPKGKVSHVVQRPSAVLASYSSSSTSKKTCDLPKPGKRRSDPVRRIPSATKELTYEQYKSTQKSSPRSMKSIPAPKHRRRSAARRADFSSGVRRGMSSVLKSY